MKVATQNYGKLFKSVGVHLHQRYPSLRIEILQKEIEHAIESSNTKLSLVDGIFNVTLQGEDLTDGKPGQVYKVAVELGEGLD